MCIRDRGRAQDRKNKSEFVGSGKEGPERASQTFFIAISNILFFPNSHPWPNFSLSYFSSGSHMACPVNVFPNSALYFVHNGPGFPGIPFQTLMRKGWSHQRGLHPLLSNYPLPIKYRILSTSSQIPHCILLSSRIPAVSFQTLCFGFLVD